MLKLLPLGIVILVIAGASGYFVFFANTPSKPIVPVSQPALDQLKGQTQSPPPTSQTDEQKIQLITNAVLELKDQVDQLRTSLAAKNGSLDLSANDKIKTLTDQIDTLQTQLTQLKSSSTTPTSTTAPTTSTAKSPVIYIPLGTGGQGGNTDWYTLNNYEIQMDPADYPGYVNMQLEVNFRLDQNNGTGYARLYNVTDNSDVGISVQTTTTDVQWYQSYFFKPASGKKTYRLQIKSATGTQMYIQDARIRVNF